MEQIEYIKAAVKALDSKHAEDIRVIGIGDLTIIADYFVIADGYFGYSYPCPCR